MNKESSDVAVVVVQGSFQTPLVYAQLSEAIRDKGYLTFQPELPSCSGDTSSPDFSKRTLYDDSEVVKEIIDDLVQQKGKRVAVVMHSYGGLGKWIATLSTQQRLICGSSWEQRDSPGVELFLPTVS
jgi:esterase/lipase